MGDVKEIAERLSQWVDSNYKKRRDFAAAMGWHESIASNYLNGRHGFGKNVQKRLEDLGAPTKWILFGDEQPPPEPVQNENIQLNDLPIIIKKLTTENEALKIHIYNIETQLHLIMERMAEYERKES